MRWGAHRRHPDPVGRLLCGRGREPCLAGLKALGNNTLDVDILMIVAALVAAAVGQVVDGGLLIVIFATSGAPDAVATKRTQDSVRALLNLAPNKPPAWTSTEPSA